MVEVLASAAEDRAAETLAPQLLELAERVAVANAQASNGLMLASASLAGKPFFGVVEERHRDRRSGDAVGTDDWFEDLRLSALVRWRS